MKILSGTPRSTALATSVISSDLGDLLFQGPAAVTLEAKRGSGLSAHPEFRKFSSLLLLLCCVPLAPLHAARQGEAPNGELYDVNKDPNEWTNLANNPEYRPVVRELAGLLPGFETLPYVRRGRGK